MVDQVPFPRFEVYEDSEGDYRWRLVARNGKIMADSAEGYTSRRGAKRAALRFKDIVEFEEPEITTEVQ